ncbi:MAG: CapA family protein [Clostridia bacterium]|nr:CapA family protein [Clostridia bacterium]
MTKTKINYHKLFSRIMSLAAIVFICILAFVYGYKPANDMIIDNKEALNASDSNTIDTTVVELEKPKDITISISVVGDIMCHDTQYLDAFNKSTGEYDFTHTFTNVADYLKNSDLTIGNLETTFAGADRKYSGYPTFNTPDSLATTLANLGFDVLSTSNNHCLDKGYSGLTRTLEVLDENNIAHMGTYSSQEARDTILVKDINGIKFAFLAYTYGTNGIPIPNGKEYSVNLIDKDLIKNDLEKAKELGVDIIAVNMHWGNEYRLKPTAEQEDLANFLFENGVDLILGSHAHVLEPMETRSTTLENGTKRDKFLIYSLGNFVSAQNKQYTDHAIILNLKLTKHGNSDITIDTVDYIPTYVENRGKNAEERFKILDVKKEVEAYEAGESEISKTLYDKLKKVITVTENILSGNI